MKQITCLLLLFLLDQPLFGQELSSDQVRSDLEFLIKSIKTYNPALEEYNPDFESNSRNVINSVSDDLNILEYFKLVSQITSFSNEGHYNLGTWEDSAHKGFLENTYSYLPVSVKILSGRVFVWSDFSGENQLQRGDEILSINKKDVQEMLENLARYIPTDGEIKTYFEKQAEGGFAWMYYLYVEQPAHFNLQIKRDGNEEIIDLKIVGLTVEERNLNNKKRYLPNANELEQKSINDLYTLSYESNRAVLTLKSFDYRLVDTYKVNADKLYRQIFEELKTKNVQHLIIDLRDNTGGRNEFADDMVPYILKDAPNDFLKKSISWEGRERTYKFPKTKKEAFSGPIYCLVNGQTYSAGATLARYLKEYGNATMIGEETGSRYEGYSAGSTQYVSLPNTDIKIGIPRYHTFYPKSTKQLTNNRGLIPDYKVQNTIQDLIEGNDKAMELSLNLIK